MNRSLKSSSKADIGSTVSYKVVNSLNLMNLFDSMVYFLLPVSLKFGKHFMCFQPIE